MTYGSKWLLVGLTVCMLAVIYSSDETLNTNFSVVKRKDDNDDNEDNYSRITPRDMRNPVHFIMGVSTGHSGSTFAHDFLSRGQQPKEGWRRTFELEAPGEKEWDWNKENDDGDDDAWCQRVRDRPTNGTYGDLGHFHNRGRTLECLAAAWNERLALVRIYRNRYQIAQSFVNTRAHFTTSPDRGGAYMI